jgi:hypothetical protein
MSKGKLPKGLTAFKMKAKGPQAAAEAADMAEDAAEHGNVKKAKLKVKFEKPGKSSVTEDE